MASVFYQGEVPYAIGFVELPEGVSVETQLTRCHFDELKVGMTVEMALEKLYQQDDGVEVVCFKFKPVER